MKIVVIGGSGLIGSKTVERLRKKGHDVVSASPNSGVNTITGEGLAQALAGAQVVIDLANSPSFDEKSAVEFFETSGRNLLAAEAAAGWGTMWPCRSSARNGSRAVAIFGARWPRRI